jgi:glycerol-3-phosphate dehydrogenase (NAD+)
MLGGQKLQGVLTCEEVQAVLQNASIVDQYPLFSTIYKICKGQLPPKEICNYRRHSL